MPGPTVSVAIVGAAALFPGSSDAAGFWRDVVLGTDCITEVPATHWRIEDFYDPDPARPDHTYCRRGGFLPSVAFDPLTYGLPPSMAPSTDSSQMLALMLARTVLDQVRMGSRARTSVILGVTSGQKHYVELAGRLQHPYVLQALREEGLSEERVQAVWERIASMQVPWNENSFPGALGNVVAGRIANRFDLGGTNCVVDAACASSLAALSAGMDELALGRADMVLSGGVDTFNDPTMFVCFSKTPALSPTGVCRPFDADADGTMLGEGLALFALKRLADAERDGDRIYAVIRGLGSSSDGRALSVYAPRSEGQVSALRRCYEQAGYEPSTVELVEAHGTGTRAGDAAEFEALRTVFGDHARQWCALGSVKAQIGHTKAAAGAAGLFKIVMALHHKVLPPTVNVTTPHPRLDLPNSPFYLSSRARPWLQGEHPRRASVSSFGFGGTNYHVTVEEYAGAQRAPRLDFLPNRLLLLAAADPAALREQCRQATPGSEGPARLAVVYSDEAQLRERLAYARSRIGEQDWSEDGLSYAHGAERGRVAFLFPGQGSQSVGMGADLAMHFEAARQVWDRLPAVGKVVFPPPGDARAQAAALTATEYAQPALAAAGAALMAVLEQACVRPDLVAGHSLGELTALHAAGVYDVETLLAVASERGARMAAAASEPGGMLAVSASRSAVEEVVRGLELAVANHNGPQQVVLSGARAELGKAQERLGKVGLTTHALAVSTAFHSPLVAGARDGFLEFLQGVAMEAPRLPVYSNGTAGLYPADVRLALADQLVTTVRFVEMVEAMYAEGARVFVEVGPGKVVSDLVRQCLQGRGATVVTLQPAGEHGVTALWKALGTLFVQGVEVRPAALLADLEAPAPVEESAGALQIHGATYGKPGREARPVARASEPQATYQQALTDGHTAYLAHLQATEANLTAAHQSWLQAMQGGAAPGGAVVPPVRPVAPVAPAPVRVPEPVLVALPVPVTVTVTGAAEVLLQIVAEKTGYPQEMLGLDMALEGDLGLDSIKRVEIMAAFSERHPQVAVVDSATLGSLQTLRQVLEAMERPPDPGFEGILLGIVAEKTGYPSELLNLDMHLEADLGIDSIKRVEILATVQERLPGLPPLESHQIGTLSTLRDVMKAMQEETLVPFEVAPAPAGALTRWRPVLAAAAPAETRALPLPIWIVPDDQGVAQELASRLPGSSVADVMPAGTATVLCLAGLARLVTPQEGLAASRTAFLAARSFASQAEGGCFVTVQDTGGSFGCLGGGSPWSAGVAALTRTAALEWPGCRVQALDLECAGRSVGELATQLLDALLHPSPGVNLGLRADGSRWSLVLDAVPLSPGAGTPLAQDSFLVVTGGARGVTASCLVELASSVRLRLLLLGRTPLQDEPACCRGLVGDAELKQALLTASDRRPTPLELAAEVTRILAAREVRATLAALEAHGSQVRYECADVADSAGLRAVLGRVRSEWGPVRGLIHGAGVLADRRLADKTPEQFDRVVSAKALGLCSLLEALAVDPLERIFLFSSVAAWSGNVGQADYALANEVLNKVALAEAAARPHCQVRSIGWGPWAGGMVTEALQKQFEARGIATISLAEGTRHFVRELGQTDSPEVVVGVL